MQITTLPVYSKLADPMTLPEELHRALPANWQLSQHQVETYAALQGDAYDVILNTAMTGDGKSLAGQLPLLVRPEHNNILALFPTNELIQDQQRSLEPLLPLWRHPTRWVGMMFGAALDTLTAELEALQRPQALLKLLNDHKLVLSNPDILHAILQFHYQQYGHTPTHVVGQLPLLFNQLTFDEFHIFDTPQVVAVLTGLLFLVTQKPHLKTLLLSATPSKDVLALLDRAGFAGRIKEINPQKEGWYHHGANPGDSWRPILQGSHIHIAQGGMEDWIAAGGDMVLLNWFRERRPGAKGALIVNSVAAALRLTAHLAPLFRTEGFEVVPNTGITGKVVRKASYDADLLIGTSTVDVGVDFRINLLVFEANSAGTFLQRLGRLGRHTSYQDRDGREHRFSEFAAYALVPPFIYERLTQADTQTLCDGETYTREQLGQCVNLHFPKPANVSNYTRTWGRFVPAKVLSALNDPRIKGSYADTRSQLFSRYSRLVQSNLVDAIKDWTIRRTQGDELLIKEAQSFRGGSAFNCGVLKPDEGDVVTYDLFWLLENAHLELLSKTAFCAEVVRWGQNDLPYKRGFQQFFFRWNSLREQREYVTVILPPEVARWGAERHQCAQVLPGFTIACAGHDELLNSINATLRSAPCVGLIIPGHDPRQVQRARYLSPGLRLYQYRADPLDAGEQVGTVAFGRNALLLDSILSIKPLGNASEAPFIF
jgi:CRISPR-associated endonuclease/helicase Cas3